MADRTGIAVATAAALLALGLPAAGADFEYLYVEANEGGSSGGHTAVRLGDRTYHFRNRDGMLVLDRDPTNAFLHEYALLDNRAIHASRVALSAGDRARLLEHFDRRHRAQARQLDVLDALREDAALLEAWRDGEAVPIPGLGFFDRDTRSAVMRGLRDEIRARRGATWIASRRRELERRLTEAVAADPSDWAAPPPRDPYTGPPFAAPFARRVLAVASGLAALDVLEDESGLLDAAVISPPGRVFELAPGERERLRTASRSLGRRLLRLVGSARADWGEPFLVGLARLLALERSLAQGRLVVLDTVPSDAPRLAHHHVASRLDLVAELLAAGTGQLEATRRRFGAGGSYDEAAWAGVEDVVNRLSELESAVREERDLRISRGPRIPDRAAPRRQPSIRPAPHDTTVSLRAVREREARYAEALRDLYGYHLIARNCVSELFATLEGAFGGETGTVAALGGHVDGRSRGSFVPFLSARQVDRELRVVDRRTIPSARERRLAAMRRSESPLWVALRESNTLTATSYRRGHRDSLFVFFTDAGGGAVLARPVLGAFNLAAAIGESVWGLARLPFDRGETLLSGLEGAVATLPELGFFNVRKGTNDWVPPDELDSGRVDVDR